jgi:hypothetical protein
MTTLSQLLQQASPDVLALNRERLNREHMEQRSRSARLRPRASEHEMQVALFDWIDAHIDDYPGLASAFAVPNGGDRHPATAARMKAEGVRAGVPDVLLLWPSHDGRYPGLAMELKVGKNQPSATQQEWLQRLKEAGFYAVVVRNDWRTAAREIIEYLVGAA